MRRNMTCLAFSMTLALIPSISLSQETGDTKKMASNSPLLQPWTGPYGGVPPWNLVREDEFLDAFDTAIAMAEEDIDAIANNPEPPTFENTIVAMEKAGRALNRLSKRSFSSTPRI